jgi:flagellar biosynthesis/type III secretory pathway protein FliH
MEEYKKSILEYDSIKTAMMLSREEGIEIGTERGIEIGMERGIEIGMKQGIEKGIEKGIEEGIEQWYTEVAKECLRNGLSIELTSKITKLSIKQIKDLLKN